MTNDHCCYLSKAVTVENCFSKNLISEFFEDQFTFILMAFHFSNEKSNWLRSGTYQSLQKLTVERLRSQNGLYARACFIGFSCAASPCFGKQFLIFKCNQKVALSQGDFCNSTCLEEIAALFLFHVEPDGNCCHIATIGNQLFGFGQTRETEERYFCGCSSTLFYLTVRKVNRFHSRRYTPLRASQLVYDRQGGKYFLKV